MRSLRRKKHLETLTSAYHVLRVGQLVNDCNMINAREYMTLVPEITILI